MQEDAALDQSRHHFHYLETFPGSFVLIAPTEKAARSVVFVHGFGGDACGTWSHFQMLIDELDEFRDWFSTTDLFFFQYKSVWERVDSSVDRALKFLDAMVPRPEEEHFLVVLDPIISEEPLETVRLSALPASRVYEEVILVGHSEGGVVIRKAILDADSDKRRDRSFLLGAGIALFAPALFGYKPSGLLGTLANFPGIGKVVDAFLSATPAYQDLNDVEGLLKPIQEETERLAEEKAYPASTARILWSRQDHVVSPGRDGKYRYDTRDYLDGHSHTTLCKPNPNYTDPISLIVSMSKALP
jgi:pimeloyl-ACP methyl ester carboxylesterase